METTTQPVTEKIIEGLKKAIAELENFRLHMALGKADAADKYEDLKKDLNEFILKAKSKLGEGNQKVNELKRKLEELELQLALGKAETKEIFQEQKKKIMKSIQEIENELKSSNSSRVRYNRPKDCL